MQPESFDIDRWIEQISKTQAREISCSECLDLISEYVDAELAGPEGPAPRLTPVAQHLGQCKVCREEYEVLHDLVDLENHGQMPSIDELGKSLGG